MQSTGVENQSSNKVHFLQDLRHSADHFSMMLENENFKFELKRPISSLNNKLFLPFFGKTNGFVGVITASEVKDIKANKSMIRKLKNNNGESQLSDSGVRL